MPFPYTAAPESRNTSSPRAGKKPQSAHQEDLLGACYLSMRRWAYPAFKHSLGSVYDPLDDNRWKRLTCGRARGAIIASHFTISKETTKNQSVRLSLVCWQEARGMVKVTGLNRESNDKSRSRSNPRNWLKLATRRQTNNVFDDVEDALGAPIDENNVSFENDAFPVFGQAR